MSNFLSGITLFVSCDNVFFPFYTESIIRSPLNTFIAYYTGFTMINGVKIIRLSLFSNVIQAYILLETGIPILPLSNNNLNVNNIHKNIQTTQTNNDSTNGLNITNENTREGYIDVSSNVIPDFDLDHDDAVSIFIETDDNFSDFNSYIQNLQCDMSLETLK